MEIYLSLGSNLGDRRAQIEKAAARLDRFFAQPRTGLSPLEESAAWGFDGPPFLDAVIRYDIPDAGQDPDLYARAILREAKAIEAEAGREPGPLFDAGGRRIYRSRPIDVDILFLDTETIQNEVLTIPHEKLAERPFFHPLLAAVASDKISRRWRALFPGK